MPEIIITENDRKAFQRMAKVLMKTPLMRLFPGAARKLMEARLIENLQREAKGEELLPFPPAGIEFYPSKDIQVLSVESEDEFAGPRVAEDT